MPTYHDQTPVFPVGQLTQLTAAAVNEISRRATDADRYARMADLRRDRKTSGPISFWGLIGTSTAVTTNQWTYAFAETTPPGASYDPWVAVSGGRTGTARNTLEAMNTTQTGVLGNGVLASHLNTADWTFALQPCPPGAIVRIYIDVVSSVDTYWFEYANGIDGTCD